MSTVPCLPEKLPSGTPPQPPPSSPALREDDRLGPLPRSPLHAGPRGPRPVSTAGDAAAAGLHLWKADLQPRPLPLLLEWWLSRPHCHWNIWQVLQTHLSVPKDNSKHVLLMVVFSRKGTITDDSAHCTPMPPHSYLTINPLMSAIGSAFSLRKPALSEPLGPNHHHRSPWNAISSGLSLLPSALSATTFRLRPWPPHSVSMWRLSKESI